MDVGDYVFSNDIRNPALEDIHQVTDWETGFRRVYLKNLLTGQRIKTDPRCYKRWTKAELPRTRVEVDAAEAALVEKRRLREEKKSRKLQTSAS
jgi:hypothetical protein